MKLEPRNKRLVLEVVKKEEEKKEELFFAGSTKRPDNVAYRVLDKANDCVLSVSVGQIVLVEGNMVEEAKFGENTFLTCKENFVIGLLRD